MSKLSETTENGAKNGANSTTVNAQEETAKLDKMDDKRDQVIALKARLEDYFSSGASHSLSWRQRQLKAFLQFLDNEEKAIYAALKTDLAKSSEEAFLTEVAYLRKDAKYLLKNLPRWVKPQKVSTPLIAWPAKSIIKPEPLGTCLVIGAWNYPFQLSLSPMLAAIAAGNCVIVKPSELASASSALIASLLAKYLDMNAIAVVQGGKDITTILLQQAFDKIFYTGGEAVGKLVLTQAAQHLTPVTLELGGKSPCVIDRNIDLQTAIQRIVWGKFMNAGQTCIAPDYLLVHHSHLDSVLDKLKKVIAKQYKKDIKNNRFYGRIINQEHTKRLSAYLEGQNVVFGGECDVENKYIGPTIVLNPDKDSPLMQEEVFGPILPVLSFSGRSDMLKFIQSKPKPLAAYLFTEDSEFEQKFVERVSAGSMCINDTAIFMANPELPFGGVGNSGMGRYHGKFGFDSFSHQKSVLQKSFSFENSFRYMPLNRFKMSILKRLFK